MGSAASQNNRAGAAGNDIVLKLRLLERDQQIRSLEAENKRQEDEINNLREIIAQLQTPSNPPGRLVIPSTHSNYEIPERIPQIRTASHSPVKIATLSTHSPLGGELELPDTVPQLTPADVISGSEPPRGNLPKVGDHVVSMWGASKWQYFTATIVSFDADSLKYTIEWDDHDPTGRVVDYYNLALDKIPAEDQIGVGSKVLFRQGYYKSQEVHGVSRSGGWRWHQGEITKITKSHGVRFYEGRHTKGDDDGKWVTYKDYSQVFREYKIDDFRMPPNVFDILDSISPGGSGTTEVADEIHVFISYAKVNSPSAIKNSEINASELPPTYEEVMIDDMCDPRDIVQHLQDMGVKVYFREGDSTDSSLLETVNALKRAKVFIACLSDEYASNDRCRMEFQYAKKTMGIPVIPVVVGTGSFQWKMTVVGLLIAGELYIHFKDKKVQGFKMNELLRSIKRHIPSLHLKNFHHPATGDASLDLVTTPGLTVTGAQLETGQADIFFSYCWTNSYQAFENQQIANVVGTRWSDPRVIQEKLKAATNASTWIDVQRLESAADGLGMFGQIATALGDCKVVVACVSNEYAESDNCRMELQFASSSLGKPIVVVVVGEGNQWRETVVGKIALMGTPVVEAQLTENSEELEKKIEELTKHVMKSGDIEVVKKPQKKKKLGGKSKKSSSLAAGLQPQTHKAPMMGDHVVCLHQGWAYYTATVVEFDPTDLVYTVDWDDGDPTGRVQSYKDVALNVKPDSSSVGVGSIVVFPQGSYVGTEGNNTGGKRYHQGRITKIHSDKDGITRYDGVHTKGKDDGKWIFRDYNEKFKDLMLDDLRISPNAMDALMACREAYDLE